MAYDFRGMSGNLSRFLSGIRARTDTQPAQDTAINAGLSYLQNGGMDQRFGGQSADRAADFGAATQQASSALGAPAGSIAARNNPFNYGSVASREFKGTFGDARPGFDALNASVSGADPVTTGLARRGLAQNIPKLGDYDGSS